MPIIVLLILLLHFSVDTSGQSHTEKIEKTLHFEKKSTQNALLVYNIDGAVTIEAGTGDQVIVEVTKTIHAKTEDRLALGKEEIQLGIMDLADTLILYIKGTGQEFGLNKTGKFTKNNYGYHGNWNGRWQDRPYDYSMTFKIMVPANIHVLASTINDGDVHIQGISGEVKALNINGAIKLTKLSGSTYAHTINGDVDIDYSKNPNVDCSYYTLNGDIHIVFPTALSGTMSFKSFNGDLYTNIASLESMSPQVIKKTTDKGTKYKIDMDRFKIRGSGPHLSIETFNGDAQIKENIQ